jgi:hypothetical protein
VRQDPENQLLLDTGLRRYDGVFFVSLLSWFHPAVIPAQAGIQIVHFFNSLYVSAMWFKNLSVYRLAPNLNLDLPKLEESLRAKPCSHAAIRTWKARAGSRRVAMIVCCMYSTSKS